MVASLHLPQSPRFAEESEVDSIGGIWTVQLSKVRIIVVRRQWSTNTRSRVVKGVR